MFSLVIPIYKNEDNLGRLMRELLKLAEQVGGEFVTGHHAAVLIPSPQNRWRFNGTAKCGNIP